MSLECGFLCVVMSWLCCSFTTSQLLAGFSLLMCPCLCPGEELIYLDPHTTQPAVEPSESGCLPDESFHCQHPPCRMSIAELDPSIAVVCPVSCSPSPQGHCWGPSVPQRAGRGGGEGLGTLQCSGQVVPWVLVTLVKQHLTEGGLSQGSSL